jgi:hypothetical protein
LLPQNCTLRVDVSSVNPLSNHRLFPFGEFDTVGGAESPQ